MQIIRYETIGHYAYSILQLGGPLYHCHNQEVTHDGFHFPGEVFAASSNLQVAENEYKLVVEHAWMAQP
jgi:hypothetical protein